MAATTDDLRVIGEEPQPSIFDSMTSEQRKIEGRYQAELLKIVSRRMRLTPHGFLVAA